MNASLPESVAREVVAALFHDAEELGWAFLNARARSKQYNLWLSSPGVGGVLDQFMTKEEARVWIKDGPMKEFSRAMNGLGKHSDLIAHKLPDPSQMVGKCFGGDWIVESETQQIKPLRIIARNGERRAIMAWAPEKDFKHLIWAALQSKAKGDEKEWVLCLTSPFVNPTPRNVQSHNERLADICNLKVVHIVV